jgi:response regulator RpfG family c-di-GMP phosphodiesterase
MSLPVTKQINPGVLKIQGLLQKIDRLQLPISSRRDFEIILARQVSKELDLALPWQAGHGRRTGAISLLIGQAVCLSSHELHDLTLAALLHDIGLLMLPSHLVPLHGRGLSLPPESPRPLLPWDIEQKCVTNLS